jgi:methylenetetrahydrofolate dehydrogenase (NADP+)/methenyltetrahydrofolate cyclohydrolase
MPATLIDGKALAAQTRLALKARVATLPYAPHLVVVLASEDPASAIYVRNKGKAAEEVGIKSTQHTLTPGTSRESLLGLIAQLNADPDVDGILVQLPLPAQHDAQEVIAAIDPAKDVDGFHPVNAGRLARGDERALVSCTPLGVIRLLEHAGAALAGARAVVLGRSNIVGRPVAELLLNRSATVTVCHSRTVDLPARIGEADIVVAAIGKPEFVQGRLAARGRHRHRRGHQQARRRQGRGRRGLRVRLRARPRDHPRPGRRRSHDHRLPPREHREGRPAAALTDRSPIV